MSGIVPAGSTVHYRVTFLEMAARPEYGWPVAPAGGEGALLRAEAPPAWYFLALYDAVGRAYAWTDRFATPREELAAWLADPAVEMFTLLRHGWPHGFFVLDARAGDSCELEYFGLVPEAIGRGLGRFLLRTAVLTAWERPGVRRLTVDTCSLDHPRALALYQAAGFTVVAQEDRTRILVHDRDPAAIPT
ncbi:MAG: GNAT family N-acetyltransferase [Rhodobacteraceae bacterium]|nr:GNAT family N-acetyltransferase [Paracoccaceae bacterium]